ncbi:MAG: hypothetical protein ABSC06_38115, partial [Rhodopila sp.]
ARIPLRTPAVAATDHGLLAPLTGRRHRAAGTARSRFRPNIGNWLPLAQVQALRSALDISPATETHAFCGRYKIGKAITTIATVVTIQIASIVNRYDACTYGAV